MKKFIYESYTEYWGNIYVTTTKIYAVIPRAARDAIGAAEHWNGCHWDAPDIIYSETMKGTEMSRQASTIIIALNADEYNDEESGE